jgi:hypothetical protein
MAPRYSSINAVTVLLATSWSSTSASGSPGESRELAPAGLGEGVLGPHRRAVEGAPRPTPRPIHPTHSPPRVARGLPAPPRPPSACRKSGTPARSVTGAWGAERRSRGGRAAGPTRQRPTSIASSTSRVRCRNDAITTGWPSSFTASGHKRPMLNRLVGTSWPTAANPQMPTGLFTFSSPQPYARREDRLR